MQLIGNARLLAAGSSLIALSLTGEPAAAQVGAVPVPAAAGVQASRPSREEVTPAAPQVDRAPRVSVDAGPAIEVRPCPFDNSPLRLTLDQVEFTRADGSALQPVIAAALAGLTTPHGDQPVRAICDIRDEANEALRKAGWIASVQVPSQEIAGGRLQLHVVTAHIVETRVRGSAGPYEALLRNRIAALEALDPLNEHEAERILLLAGDVPGLEVQLALRPANNGAGNVIGELNINYRRFAILGNAQNYNSKLLGRETGYLRAEYYGLTGLGDVTYVGVSSTPEFREQRIAQIGHITAIDQQGTTLGARFSYALSRPSLGTLDYRTTTVIGGFDLGRSIIRSLGGNLSAALGVDYVDQTTNLGTGASRLPLTRDQLRIGFIDLVGDKRRLRLDGSMAWSLRGTVELRKGFDVLGATRSGIAGGLAQSRVNGNSRAFVARATGQATIGIGRYVSLLGEEQVQWSNDPLLNYEQFSLGNLTIGRGYDPGSNSGDRAIGLRGEAQVNLPIRSPVKTQLFGFYDYVRLKNLDPSTLERDRRFRSYGGGLRFALPGTALLEVTYAHPLDRALTIDRAPPPNRLLVSLSFRFRDSPR